MEIMSPKKKKTTTTTLHVPNDAIIEILSWVPANSLLRLRWACKYWFHLITEDHHDFVKLHVHRSTLTTTIHPHNLSVLISKQVINPLTDGIYSKPCKIFQYYIDYSTTTTTTTTTTGSVSGRATNQILYGIFENFHILGSCHGLILFGYYYLQEGPEAILCLWNPCTKEYKYLPKPYGGFHRYQGHTYGISANFGLGYDHSIEDYKVIYNVRHRDGSIHVQVYTLQTNSWRYIRTFTTNYTENKHYGFYGNGVFVNGALHFIYKEGAHYPGASRILSLDFEKEMYVEISNQPGCFNDKAKSIQGRTMFEGSLCLTMQSGETWTKILIEVWVMKKDYNMNNNQEYSWSKLYEIPHIDGLRTYLLQPQRFTKDGEILLLDREEQHGEHLGKVQDLLLLDPKNDKITIHKVYKLHPIEQAATYGKIHKIEDIYIESLVSLNSGTYIEEIGD